MRRPVVLTDDAKADVRAAAAWYNSQRKGLGKRFNQATRAALAQLSKTAEAHSKMFGEVRQTLIAGFPAYVIHYIVRPNQVVVFSVFHSSRDPRLWQLRVGDLDNP
jgi:plasmid stabilization system protein ParE